MFDDSLMGAIKWSLWFATRCVRETKGTDTSLCGVRKVCNHAFAKTDVTPRSNTQDDSVCFFMKCCLSVTEEFFCLLK